jgi:long-chain acyl-CoA synthetase
MMERFDAEDALRFIEQYKITSAQWVPTHFVRMLKLPPEARRRYDMSSLKACSTPRALPGAGQGADDRLVGPDRARVLRRHRGQRLLHHQLAEWLAHKGSVGRGHDRPGEDLRRRGRAPAAARRGPGVLRGGGQFEYHGDPAKTAESRNKHGWTTLGDVGWVDEEGYLYLTDRKSFMIISGGVNIYPQEIENLLIGHPKVADVAVVGGAARGDGRRGGGGDPARRLGRGGGCAARGADAYARTNLSHVKAPRKLDFMEELPRHPTGKLYKRLIRDAYWGKTGSKIV